MLSRRSQQQQQRGVGVGDVPSARVLVVGEAGVGKSALVRALLALDPPRARERAAGGEPREREEAPVRTVGVDVHALVLGGDDAGAEVRVLAMRRVVSTPLAVLGAHFKGRASVWVWPAWPCGRLALF